MCCVVIDAGLVGSTDLSGRGAARAEDAQGTPTQSHISPSILVYEDYKGRRGTSASVVSSGAGQSRTRNLSVTLDLRHVIIKLSSRCFKARFRPDTTLKLVLDRAATGSNTSVGGVGGYRTVPHQNLVCHARPAPPHIQMLLSSYTSILGDI